MGNVKVETRDDYFASLEHERVLVEFSKDGDSPNCPLSWTWDMWIDGEHIDGTCDEASLARAVKDAVGSIDETVGELTVVRDYLMAYEVFGAEPDDGGVHHVISVLESGGRIMSRGFNMLRDYIENDALAMRRSKCREIEHELQREFEDLKVENNRLRVLCAGMYKDMQGVLDMATDTVWVDSICTLRDAMDCRMRAMRELCITPADYKQRMRELGINSENMELDLGDYDSLYEGIRSLSDDPRSVNERLRELVADTYQAFQRVIPDGHRLDLEQRMRELGVEVERSDHQPR